jgi:HAD superfamily hydrolase (TIGR01509 family)
MNNHLIKALFVDLGGVLVLNHSDQVYQEYNKKHGVDSNTLRSVFKFIHSGQPSKEEVERYLEKVGLSKTVWESFKKDFFASEVRNNSLYQLLLDLKQQKSMLIFFTTNNGAKLEKVLKKYDLLNLPDYIVNSSLVEATKPSMPFWQFAYKKIQQHQHGIQKNEIMVIDDSTENIDSAKNFGFQTLLYKTEGDNEKLLYLKKIK